MRAARAWLQLARPLQWVKNGFVLLPLLFGHALLQADAVLATLIATAAFCLASSAVYAGNDIVDAERDRRHPDKCLRPVARGELPPSQAWLFSGVLALAGLLLAWSVTPKVAAVIAAYLLLQVAYSGGLKRIAYVDVLIIASGFALRIVAGGFAADVPLTRWIVVMGFLLALMLALGKRHGDLVHCRDAGARAALGYSLRTVERLLSALGGAIIVAYLFYTLSPEVLARHGHHPLVFSTPWVVLGLLRYLYLVFRHGGGGDPSRLALRDPGLLLATAGWLVTLVVVLYR